MATTVDSFTQATAVTAGSDGTYGAEIPAAWNVPVGIHGGVLMATTLRAATARLDDPEQPLRTAHGSFYARPAHNRLAIATREVRRGRTTSHVEADTAAAGQDGVALATRTLFTRRRPGELHLDVPPPAVPAPETCPVDGTGDDESPLGRPELLERMDARRAAGTYPWSPDWKPDLPMRYSRWCRYHDRPELPDGSYDVLALLPLADLPGPTVWVHYAPDEPLRLLSSLELTLHVLEPVTDDWVLADFRARWLGDGYTITECDLWSGGRLVAHAMQSMMLRLPPSE